MTSVKRTTEAILFDHDDTLVQTQKIKWEHNKFIAKKFYGKELCDEEILIHWGKPLGEMACALFGTKDVNTAMQYIENTRGLFPKALFPDTVRVLRHLKAKGAATGVVTATSQSNFTYDCSHLQLPPFDYVQTFDDTDVHKPDPKVFEPALAWASSIHLHPQDMTYVGDSLHDMRAAQGAGLNFIGVSTGLVSIEEFADHGAQSISGLHELIATSVK